MTILLYQHKYRRKVKSVTLAVPKYDLLPEWARLVSSWYGEAAKRAWLLALTRSALALRARDATLVLKGQCQYDVWTPQGELS